MSILKKFTKYYKPYRKIFYIDMFCALIVSAIDIAFPQVLRLLTSGLFSKAPDIILQSIPWLAVGLLGAIIVRLICQYYITTVEI